MNALLLLALLLGAPPGDAERSGREAVEQGCYEEAVALLRPATEASPSYEGLVALGVALARLERGAEALSAFDRAVELDPRRPEAHVERGGIAFLGREYARAAGEFRAALEVADDPYAREMLASSLYLADRRDEALDHWNRLGRPRLRAVTISGLRRTRDAVARREVGLAEGEVLTSAAVRRARRRLEEMGVFSEVTVRTEIEGDGRAGLDVALAERHGLGTPVELLVSTLANAARQRAFLRYANLGGRGITLGGGHRWDPARPLTALEIEWPRPFGFPGRVRLEGGRGRSRYVVDGKRFDVRSRGADLSVRHVVGARTAGQWGVSLRDRTSPLPGARPGAVLGLSAGVERRLLDRRTERLEAGLEAFQAVEAFGADLGYRRWTVSATYRRMLAPPEEVVLQRRVLAARALYGWGGAGIPVDAMFLAGAASDMPYPLRGHGIRSHDALGASPIGRTLVLGNLEWRERLVRSRNGLLFGLAAFYDVARVGGAWQGPLPVHHDVGLGVRAGYRKGPLLRIDWGHGLRDGRDAVTVGFSEVF